MSTCRVKQLFTVIKVVVAKQTAGGENVLENS